MEKIKKLLTDVIQLVYSPEDGSELKLSWTAIILVILFFVFVGFMFSIAGR